MRTRKITAVLAIIVGITLTLATGVCSAGATRIAIFPFDILAGENLEFLQRGIFEMLSSRLVALGDDITVVSRDQILTQASTVHSSGSIEEKFAMARALDATHVISGSLTVLGENISTDARFYEVGNKTPLVVFNETGTKQGDVIGHIDRFAAKINQQVFKRTEEARAPQASEPKGTQPHRSAYTQHPEKLLRGAGYEGTTGSGLIMSTQDSGAKDRWRSRRFKTLIKGIAVGDIDGDGGNECVFIDDNTIYVYRFESGRFVKLLEFQKSRVDLFLTVDVADINGNGKSEIFITNYSNLNERLSSFVVEYTGKGLALIEDNTNWYYRVISGSTDQPFLLGQKHSTRSLFFDRIHILSYENGRYVPTGSVTPPGRFNIYEMTFSSSLKNFGRVYLGYVRNHEVAAFSSTGERIWTSGVQYDGSLTYFEYTDSQFKEKARQYIPQRILLTDTDGNGHQEMIAVKNTDVSVGLMANVRIFKKGYVECLEWDGSYGFTPKWKTTTERGYLSDFFVADATNDGKEDLIFVVVSNVAIDLEKSSSHIVIQQLP